MYFFRRARIELNKVVNTCALSVPFHTVFVTHMNLSFLCILYRFVHSSLWTHVLLSSQCILCSKVCSQNYWIVRKLNKTMVTTIFTSKQVFCFCQFYDKRIIFRNKIKNCLFKLWHMYSVHFSVCFTRAYYKVY